MTMCTAEAVGKCRGRGRIMAILLESGHIQQLLLQLQDRQDSQHRCLVYSINADGA